MELQQALQKKTIGNWRQHYEIVAYIQIICNRYASALPSRKSCHHALLKHCAETFQIAICTAESAVHLNRHIVCDHASTESEEPSGPEVGAWSTGSFLFWAGVMLPCSKIKFVIFHNYSVLPQNSGVQMNPHPTIIFSSTATSDNLIPSNNQMSVETVDSTSNVNKIAVSFVWWSIITLNILNILNMFFEI